MATDGYKCGYLPWPWSIERTESDHWILARGADKGRPSEQVATFIHADRAMMFAQCLNAIESAADRLGIDPGVLAERLADGGIAGVVTAAVWYRDRLRKDIGFDSDGPVMDGPDMVELEKVIDVLRPFTKEQPNG